MLRTYSIGFGIRPTVITLDGNNGFSLLSAGPG
jgi:hypothetical protein